MGRFTDFSDDDGLYESLEFFFFVGSLEVFFFDGQMAFLWVKVVC